MLHFLVNKSNDCKVEGHEKLRLLVIYRQEFRQQMPLRKDHSYDYLVVFEQTRKLPSHSHYHGKSFYKRLDWIISVFELRLS